MNRSLTKGLLAATVLCLAAGLPASAQTTVGFLHGFNDSSAVWYGAAASLSQQFGFTYATPSLPSDRNYEYQASTVSGFGSSDILVGHSNGGIVARYYGTTHPLRGVVTYGSPNWGAPILYNAYYIMWFAGRTAWDLEGLANEIPYLGNLFPYSTAADADFIATLLAGVGMDVLEQYGWLGAEVQNYMLPGSDYVLNDMNGPTRVGLENSNISVEGSVSFVTDPHGAFMRFLSPSGVAWQNIADDVGYLFLGAANYLYLYGDWDDQYTMDLADRLDSVGTDVLAIDFVWCVGVTGDQLCGDYDGLVPLWSQQLGRGFDVVIRGYDGVHTWEPSSGADVLGPVFRTQFSM